MIPACLRRLSHFISYHSFSLLHPHVDKKGNEKKKVKKRRHFSSLNIQKRRFMSVRMRMSVCINVFLPIHIIYSVWLLVLFPSLSLSHPLLRHISPLNCNNFIIIISSVSFLFVSWRVVLFDIRFHFSCK